MEKLNIKDIVRLNHKLFLKKLSFKINLTDDYSADILPIGREEGNEAEKAKVYEIVNAFYEELDCDVMFDMALMSFHVYSK